MKKLFSTLILSSLIIPSYVAAEDAGQMRMMRQGETLRVRATSTQGEKKELVRLYASSTRERLASTTKDTGFCSQIDKALVYIDTKASSTLAKKDEHVQKVTDKREEVRSTVDTRIDTHREETTQKRKAQLEELTKRATTDNQKTAVTAFITTLEKATKDRETAIDAILLAHRTEADATLATRKSITDRALATLRTDVEKAKTQAQADCANKISGDIVRTNLKNALQKAQETFKKTVQLSQKEILSAKKDSRKESLEAIEATFKKSIEQARNNLKTSFAITSSATSTAQ